jgi:predicted ATP-grasp superfamily ATP-dependent carboligase
MGTLEDARRHAAAGAKAPAVVADVGWVNGLAAIRSLGRAGVPVVALDRHRSALGFRSRYALGIACPDPVAEEGAFVELLVALADALGRPAPIFPTHDEELAAVAKAAPVLGGRYLYPFPPWETVERIQRKRVQLEEAQAAGVPIPATAYPASAAEALSAGDDMGYPVLVKPSEPVGFRRRFRRQAFRCRTPEELGRAFADSEPFVPMVQELVPGGDEELYTLGSYLAADGEALGLFSGRKLRQTPPTVGTCRVGEAVWVQEVVDQGLRLLSRLGFHGLSQVEFKRDPRDGRYKLMEVNPRLWQWHGLASACGVDLVRLAYRDLLGDRPAPSRPHADGRRWAITLMAGERPAVPRMPYSDAVLALDDPGPAFAQVARILRRAFT